MNSRTIVIIAEAIIIIILLIIVTKSCEPGSQVTEEISEPPDIVVDQSLVQENNELHEYIDSLSLAIEQMRAENLPPPKLEYEDDDNPEIRALINNINQGWYDMSVNDDPNEVLQYFMPKNTTNEVFINTENLPHVERHNNRDLQEHLEALIKAGDVTIKIVKPQIFKIFVRQNIFTAMYLVEVNVYRANEKVHRSTVLVSLSGEKYEMKEWRAGNISWIEFEYFDVLK